MIIRTGTMGWSVLYTAGKWNCYADFGIAVRAGLHCDPLVHESIGTFPDGGSALALDLSTVKRI